MSKNLDTETLLSNIKFNHKSQTPDGLTKTLTPSKRMAGDSILQNATNNIFFGEKPRVDQKTIQGQTNKNFTQTKDYYKNETNHIKPDTYRSLLTPQIGGLNSNPDDYNGKQMINLDDLCFEEEKLWKILECLRMNANVGISCEQWMAMSHMSSIQNIDNFFQNKSTKTEIKFSNTLEVLSVNLALCLIYRDKINNSNVANLKNLFYNIHQNLLIIISMILSRIPTEMKNNMFVVKLTTLVINKQIKSFNDDDVSLLNQSNYIISNLIKNLVNSNFKNQSDSGLLNAYNDFLQNNDKYTYEHIKGEISNIKSHYLNYYMSMKQNDSKMLKIPSPYLPPLHPDQRNSTYTLVIDLDETLIHSYMSENSEDNEEFLVRPNCEKFLSIVSKYYEVVVFTAAIQTYADRIIDKLDVDKNWIKYRLYRQHATHTKSGYIKDISKIGRDLSKTIIIDNLWENFQFQHDNGIFIKSWYEDPKDNSLMELVPLLKFISNTKVQDVRKTLRKYRDIMIRLHLKGDLNPYETLRKCLDNEE